MFGWLPSATRGESYEEVNRIFDLVLPEKET